MSRSRTSALTLAAARNSRRPSTASAGRASTFIAKRRRTVSGSDTFGVLAVEFVRDWKTQKWQTRPRRWRGDAAVLGLRWPPDCEDPTAVEPTLVSGGLAERWSTRQIADIDGHDIHGVVDEARKLGIPGLDRRNDQVSENRGRKMHAALSVFFRWSTRQRKVTANPCTGVWRPGAPPARQRVLSPKEIREFWQATEKLGTPFGPLLRLLLLTGQRREEVSGLRRDELRGDEWHLQGARTKNHLPNVVPLSKEARELIESVPVIEGCPFVFSTNGVRPVSGWSKIKARLDRLMPDVEPWTIHDIRRSVVTGMNELGIAPHIVEIVVNHISGSRGGVAGTYNHAKHSSEKRDALERWARHVTNAEIDNVLNLAEAAAMNSQERNMKPRQRYTVTMRRLLSGDEITKLILADSEATARARAPVLARRGLESMADRHYAQFEVLSCVEHRR